MGFLKEKNNTVITIEKVGDDLYTTKVHGEADDGLIGAVLICALCDHMKKLAKKRGIPQKNISDIIIRCVKKALIEEPSTQKEQSK